VEQHIKQVGDRLNAIGFERTRRAVAALALSLFVFLYLALAANPPIEGWQGVFLGFSACYAIAFMGVAAEWFWGRWFAAGLGWSGIMVATVAMVQIGEWVPAMGIYGGLHLLVVMALAGKKMADRFDLQPAWRERYGMDEYGVARLRKTVTRASAALPSVIIYALQPPQESGHGMAFAGMAALVLTVAGLRGVLRARTWGLAALAASAVVVFATGDILSPTMGLSASMPRGLGLGPTLAAAFLAVAVAPFVGPAIRYLRSR
jgi:hypothetical protein